MKILLTLDNRSPARGTSWMSGMPKYPSTNYTIYLKDIHGQLLPATVETGYREWTEPGRRHTECRITLKWSGNEIECIEWNFFESFKRVREQLAMLGLYPMCYGASRNIVVTGMALDMGLGARIYKGAKLKTFPTREQLVDIFASGEDVEPVSVEEQEEFRRAWVESIRSEHERPSQSP